MFGNKTQADIEREQQINAGRNLSSGDDREAIFPLPKRRITLNNNNKSSATNNHSYADQAKTGFQAKGHDAVLKAAQDRKARVTFIIDGIKHVGVIIARDRYTVSAILDGDDTASVIYKHKISMFKVEKGDK